MADAVRTRFLVTGDPISDRMPEFDPVEVTATDSTDAVRQAIRLAGIPDTDSIFYRFEAADLNGTKVETVSGRAFDVGRQKRAASPT